eukprot:CAMPEP_0174923918 /NCGR_PEP_ID=MMETSP1355-20121228/6900_1 /TAXON_ID=464990 /ORGANISM="Hemiselmis tepida, Strain CCMP443" /LENGTH=3102 /DNA_ID=CAMNT_0016169659 /DNA_START=138 /DNA_END=9443 /DNA_ORIENTATION=+
MRTWSVVNSFAVLAVAVLAASLVRATAPTVFKAPVHNTPSCWRSHYSSSCLGSVKGYVLNMDQYEDRWDNMVEWWGSVWPELSVSRVQTLPTEVRGLGSGAGHIKALEMAVADGVDFALILEDDALPYDVSQLYPHRISSWSTVLGNLVAQLPPHSSVLLLGGHHIHPNPKWDTDPSYRAACSSKGLVQIFRAYGAYAYVVRRDQIPPLLSLWKQHVQRETQESYSIDTAWWELWETSPAFLATPLMVDHASGFSHTWSKWVFRDWEGIREWWTVARDASWSDMYEFSGDDEAYIEAPDFTIVPGEDTDFFTSTVLADGSDSKTQRNCGLVVLVLSARENFFKRQLLRERLELHHKPAEGKREVFFFVGQACEVPFPVRRKFTCEPSAEVPLWMRDQHLAAESEVESWLIHENAEHGDVVFLPTVDVYRNLPRKLKDVYSWALANVDARWLMKADDDIIVLDFDGLVEYLCDLEVQEKVVVGKIAKQYPVHRDGKWAELDFMRGVEDAVYPPFPKGSHGHVVSRDVAAAVTELDGFEYQGEDTSLGIWIDESYPQGQITWIDSRGFQRSDTEESASVLFVLGDGGNGSSAGEQAGWWGDSGCTDSVERRLDQVLAGCGDICNTNLQGVESKYFPMIVKDVNCTALWDNSAIDSSRPLGPAPEIPASMVTDFSYGGLVEMTRYSEDLFNQHQLDASELNASGVDRVWTQETINLWSENCGRGKLEGTYGTAHTRNLLDGLLDMSSVRGGHVLVIGSETPWVEACLLYLGARMVTTLEYSHITCDHPRVQTMVPAVARKKFADGTMPVFDAVVSYSSVEHSGLGRYGDALNPWGDLQTMARAWCVTRCGGGLLLSVPAGPDIIRFNAHREYGPLMFSHLTANWIQDSRQGMAHHPVLLLHKPIFGGHLHHELTGRLGNQLFQWASICGIAALHRMEPCMHGGGLAKFFDGVGEDCDAPIPDDHTGEENKYATHISFDITKSVVLDGYLQSWKYFASNVRSVLKFKPDIQAEAAEFLREYRPLTTVGIHVRHKHQEEVEYLRFPPVSYFQNVLFHFRSKYSPVQFVVASDDTEWCLKQSVFRASDVRVVRQQHGPAVDMAILAACDHMVVTVGSFGWWAAYLGADAKGGEVVYYDSAFDMEHPTNQGNVLLADYFPPGWTAMGPGPQESVPSQREAMLNLTDWTRTRILQPAGAGMEEVASHRHTLVTAYFKLASKHKHDDYLRWMENMLSLQDAMVIFCSPDMSDAITKMRSHAIERTVLVPMSIRDTDVCREYDTGFWARQLDRDPEKLTTHAGIVREVFCMWLSKSWFVSEAIRINPFSSDIFVWSDIGCFRDGAYSGRMWLCNFEIIPQSSMLMMQSNGTRAVEEEWVVKEIHGVTIAGSQFAGYRETWERYHRAFKATLRGYVAHDLFVGEDQAVMETTCMHHPGLCVVVPKDMVRGDLWFGLKDALHREQVTVDQLTELQQRGDKEVKVLVTGSGHSGTSFAAMLFGAENAGHSDEYHPFGIFEEKDVTGLNEEIMRRHGLGISDLAYVGWDGPLHPDLLGRVRSILERFSVLKDPRFVFTLPYWLSAAKHLCSPSVVVLSYRSPLCACRHPNCPNCGGNCFERVSRHARRVLQANRVIVVDMDAFFESPGPTWRRIAAEARKFGVVVRPWTVIASMFAKRAPCEDFGGIDARHILHGRESLVTKQVVSTHFRVTHPLQCDFCTPSHTTVVTALWDLNRDLVGDGRTFEVYETWLRRTMQMNASFVVFAAESSIARIRPARQALGIPTCYISMQFEEHPYYKRFFVLNKEILQSVQYRSRVQDPHRVEVINPWYNIVQWGKVELMRIAVDEYDPFQSPSVIWVDAGLSRFFPDGIPTQPFPKPHLVEDMTTSGGITVEMSTVYPVQPTMEWICKQPYQGLWNSHSRVVGTVLMASSKHISFFERNFSSFLLDSLGANRTANDQIILAAMNCENPDLVRIVQTDSYEKGQAQIHRALYGHVGYTISRHDCLNTDFIPEHRTSVWTMLTDDANYVTGAVVLGHSFLLNSNLAFDLVVMELKSKPLGLDAWARLREVGWKRCVVSRIAPLDEEGTFPRFRDQFTKIQLWRMTAYDKILYLDADTLVVKSPDLLLQTDLGWHAIGAAKDIRAGEWVSTFNMGVFLLRPNLIEFRRLSDLQKAGTIAFETTMCEQGWFNEVYKNMWHDIGFVHNANLASYVQDHQAWNSFSSNIRIIHFTMNKPWTACEEAYQPVCEMWQQVHLKYSGHVRDKDQCPNLAGDDQCFCGAETHFSNSFRGNVLPERNRSNSIVSPNQSSGTKEAPSPTIAALRDLHKLDWYDIYEGSTIDCSRETGRQLDSAIDVKRRESFSSSERVTCNELWGCYKVTRKEVWERAQMSELECYANTKASSSEFVKDLQLAIGAFNGPFNSFLALPRLKNVRCAEIAPGPFTRWKVVHHFRKDISCLTMLAIDPLLEVWRQSEGSPFFNSSQIDGAKLTFVSAPLEDMQVMDGSVDLLLMFNTLPHVQDAFHVLDQAFRLLAPGGHLILYDLAYFDNIYEEVHPIKVRWPVWESFIGAFEVLHSTIRDKACVFADSGLAGGMYGESAGIFVIARKVQNTWPYHLSGPGSWLQNLQKMASEPHACQIHGDWEPPAHPHTCIYLDIGAHNGDTYRAFTGEHNSKVSLFGDLPSDLRTTCTSILFEANELFLPELEAIEGENFRVMNSLVDTCDGFANFFVNTGSGRERCADCGGSVDSGHHSKSSGIVKNVTSVNLIRVLAEETTLTDNVYVKMNIEGAEWNIIPCLVRSKYVRHIDHLWIEVHTPDVTPTLAAIPGSPEWTSLMLALNEMQIHGVHLHFFGPSAPDVLASLESLSGRSEREEVDELLDEDDELPINSSPNTRLSKTRPNCVNGEKFFHLCICHLEFSGDDCSHKVSVNPQSKPPCRWDPSQNPFCMALPEWGRIRYHDEANWRDKSQVFEMKFWQQNAVPNQNYIQIDAFKNFTSLPTQLGDVLEIGCGPYTKLRMLIEVLPHVQVSNIYLQDPMVHRFPLEARACTYANGEFCVPDRGCNSQVWFTSAKAEDLRDSEKYDTVIMMNVLEHCLDALEILRNIFYALKTGGILVFW